MAAANTDLLKKSYPRLSTTLQNAKALAAATVTLADTTNWPTDTGINFTVYKLDDDGEPDDATATTWTGTVNGSDIENLVLQEGTDQTYDAGDPVTMFFTADHWNDMVEHNLTEHAQDGTHTNITATSIVTDSLTVSGAATAGGWEAVTAANFAYLSNDGAKQYTIDEDGDTTGLRTKGSRIELTPTTARGTQSIDFESSSSQYASKSSPSGITFTDDFTCEAWIKLESIGSNMEIVSRFSSTGFLFRVNTTGGLQLSGVGGSGTDVVLSDANVLASKLGVWTHVAANIDMSSSTGVLYVDGAQISSSYSNSGSTSITQAGNLVVGAFGAGTNPFDGKIKDVRVWSDIRTATEIQDNMNIELTGSEPNLVANYKLEGDYTDDTSNSNDLTASGGPVFGADSPYNAKEFGIVTDVSDYEEVTAGKTTLTLFTGTDHNTPNDTFSAVRYSTNYAPQGYPMNTDIVETQETTEAEGVWKKYTPTHTGITLGSGATTDYKYIRTGTKVKVQVQIVFGSSPSFTSSSRIGLPFPAVVTLSAVSANNQIGTAYILDSGASSYVAIPRLETEDVIRLTYLTGTSGAITGTPPFTFTTGDALFAQVEYEAA